MNEKQKEFLDAYNELIKIYEMAVIAIPRWVQHYDGTYSMKIDYLVKEIKNGNN